MRNAHYVNFKLKTVDGESLLGTGDINLAGKIHNTRFFHRDEFFDTAGAGFLRPRSGGGGIESVPPVEGEKRAGTVQLYTSTVPNINQYASFTTDTSDKFLISDGNKYYFGCGVRVQGQLFDGTNTGDYFFGFSDAYIGLGSASVGFMSTNGGVWKCVAHNSTGTTEHSTGLSVAEDTWRDLAFIVYPGGTKVEFFSQNIKIATFHTGSGTSTPTDYYAAKLNLTQPMSIKGAITRTADTGTQHTIDVDYMDFGIRYSQVAIERNSLPLSTF